MESLVLIQIIEERREKCLDALTGMLREDDFSYINFGTENFQIRGENQKRLFSLSALMSMNSAISKLKETEEVEDALEKLSTLELAQICKALMESKQGCNHILVNIIFEKTLFEFIENKH